MSLRYILYDRTFTSVIVEQTPKRQQWNLTFSCNSSLFLVEFLCFCAGGGSCVYCIRTLLPFGRQRRVLRPAHDMWPSRQTDWVSEREYHDCHHPYVSCTEIDIGYLKNKNQLDVTSYFIVLLIGSICFGHYYAHHQELATIMLITTHPGHYSSLPATNLQLRANQERNDQCGNQHYSRELLMMGIVVPETYWAYKKYNIVISDI